MDLKFKVGDLVIINRTIQGAPFGVPATILSNGDPCLCVALYEDTNKIFRQRTSGSILRPANEPMKYTFWASQKGMTPQIFDDGVDNWI